LGASGGSEGGHTIEDEGTPLTKRTKLNFVGAGVAVADDSGDDATDVTITGSGSGEANTSSNDGTGAGLAKAKVSVDLPFKSLIGGTRISLDDNANDVTINADAVKLDDAGTPDDNTDLDSTTSLHGLHSKADKTKLDGIASLAEVNPAVVSQADAEAGTATDERIWTAQRVKQAIDALSGGGGGGWSFVFKATDETINSSTTFQNDDDLVFAVEASKIYVAILVAFVDSPANADFKDTFTVPTDTLGQKHGSNAFLSPNANSSYDFEAITTNVNGTTDGTKNTPFFKPFFIFVDTTTGNVQYQWAQVSSQAGNTTVKTGSYIMYRKLN